MQISGSGIITFSAKIKLDFQPVTHYALDWHQVSSGNYYATDRGAAADYYDAENVRIYGTEATINTFIMQVEANRHAGSNVITLSSFNASEEIFGADVDYSGGTYPVLVTVLEIGRRAQNTWKGWSVTMKLRLLSPSAFIGVAALPSMRCVSVGVDADADRSIIKLDTYNNTFFYIDQNKDTGTFAGQFIFTELQMRNLRRFMATNRAAAFSLPGINGITYPFGPNRAGSGYPYNVKLLKIEDEHLWNDVGRWSCKLMIAEEV